MSSSSTAPKVDVWPDQEHSRAMIVVARNRSDFTPMDVGVLLLHSDALGTDILDEDRDPEGVYAEGPRGFVLFRAFIKPNVTRKKAKHRLREIVAIAVAFIRNPAGFRVVSSNTKQSATRPKAEHRGCVNLIRRRGKVGTFVPAY